MRILYFNSDEKNIYKNTKKFNEIGCKQKHHRGKSYTLHTYRDKHSKGIGFKISRGFLAALATISVIGIVFFRQQVMQLWKESVTGLEKYQVYVLDSKENSLKFDTGLGAKGHKGKSSSTKDTKNDKSILLKETKKSKKTSNKRLFEKDELRIVSRGLLGNTKFEGIKELIDIIMQVINDEAAQRSYFGDKQHPGVGIIDFNKAKAMLKNTAGFSFMDLQAAIRLMILRGDVAFMASARCGFYVGTNEEIAGDYKEKSMFFDRDDLIRIDQYILDHHIDAKALEVGTKKPDLVDKIIDQINRSLFHRARGSTNAKQLTSDKSCPFEKKNILDQLVQKGTIHSYNISQRMMRFVVKLAEDDNHDKIDYIFKVWRDKAVVEKEKQFQKQNKVEVSNAVMKEFTGDGSMLKSLLEKLNNRVNHGPFNWYSGNAYKASIVVKFLKENGVIYDHSNNYSGPVIINVKPEDKI